ncbi:Bro-N domain-containing protein [Streptacidiphilus sp. 4-A2]|nr:Bro-N domain-containing protein [Streptacidiphilus sp. 4-A2]
MQHQEQPTLTQTAFPVTGQPIRVVMIDGEPWFATLDVCRILGREQPHRASKLVQPHETQTVNVHSITRTSSMGNRESADQNGSHRGSPLLNVVSEAGLYTLIMRSRKPAAKPFQEWVTADLLPSLRRGDADLGAQRERMAETLSEALGGTTELIARIEGAEEVGFQVLSDGSVLCRHGQTDVCVPNKEEDYGPPSARSSAARSCAGSASGAARASAPAARSASWTSSADSPRPASRRPPPRPVGPDRAAVREPRQVADAGQRA